MPAFLIAFPADSNRTGSSISAETFDFPITIDGIRIGDHRWNDSNDGGYFGLANEVTDELVVGLTAFTVTAGPGIDESIGNPFLDEGYDPAADAFLLGTVDITAAAPGKITRLPGFNGLSMVNFIALDRRNDPKDATPQSHVSRDKGEVLLSKPLICHT